MKLNLLLPEQIACVEGIPHLNLPFSLQSKLFMKELGCFFGRSAEIPVNEEGDLEAVWCL